jgi:hypothetical protein
MFVQSAVPAFAEDPAIHVRWNAARDGSLRVELLGEDPQAPACLRGGFEVSYRYELELCLKRTIWFDSCLPTRLLIQALAYDPLAETYKVTTDLLGDEESPLTEQFTRLAEAQARLAEIPKIRQGFFGAEESLYRSSGRALLSVRLVASCKGEFSETLSRVSYLLSLGLMRTSGFTTGWHNFALTP